jgi:archaemetzincin
MKVLRLVFLWIILVTCFGSCSPSLPPANRVFVVQPFTGFPASQTSSVYEMLKGINSKTILRKPIPLPAASFNSARDRFRADSIINYLNHFGNIDTVIVGLTGKDISIAKGKIADWGIMGLGFEPGNACVVSTFRLSKAALNSQLYKLVLHELGHTQGLPHCKNRTCFMRDAEGSNHLDEETAFCSSCKSFLKSKGWQLK